MRLDKYNRGHRLGNTNVSKISNPDISYFRNIRSEIAEYVKKGSNRVLDVGCGAGYFGEYLKQQGCASEVVGIEIDTIAAKEALTKLDRVLCANLNQTNGHL